MGFTPGKKRFKLQGFLAPEGQQVGRKGASEGIPPR